MAQQLISVGGCLACVSIACWTVIYIIKYHSEERCNVNKTKNRLEAERLRAK